MLRKRLIKSNNPQKSQEKNGEFDFDGTIIKLDEYQRAVVNADSKKNIRIIACAGSGKTTTILCRIKHLIDLGVNPKKIMITTFNVEASDNLKKRLAHLMDNSTQMRIGTFDSICAHFYFKYFKQDHYVGVNEYSNLLLQYLQSESKENILNQYDYIFFDEFQDINEIQFKIIYEFYKSNKIITVIGDDAQNIYQWRGSNISYILNFDKEFANSETFKLENNYRSTPEIIAMANSIIKNNSDQIEKNMFATNKSINKKPQIRKYRNSSEQAQTIIKDIIARHESGVKLDAIVVIARNNFSLKLFEEEIELFNKKFNQRKIEYVAMITDNDKQASNQNYSNKLCLATIHKIKGAEWSYVYIIDLDDKYFPSDVSDIGIQEERRLFYVAVTRAKLELTISFQSNTISRFITEIPRNLYVFPDYDDKYFSISDERNVQLKTKVTEIIALLNEKDLQELREKNIIPKITPKETKLHESTRTDKNISDNNLQADYGIYIDTYISRRFGMENPHSAGLENDVARLVINSIQLSTMDFSLYCEFRLQSKFLLNSKYDYLKIETNIANNLDKGDKRSSQVKNLINKIIIKAKEINVKPHEIYITKIGYLPQEFNKEMSSIYNDYVEQKEISKESIYKISLCQNIYANRKRLLYRNVFDYFDSNKQIYANIEKFINKYKQNKIKSKYVVVNNDYMISGELDLLDITNRKIIDYKTSSNTIQLDWIIQLLTYTALIRLNTNYKIDSIEIYNPLSGIEYEIDVSSWHSEKELLEKLNTIRNLSLDREKLNIIKTPSTSQQVVPVVNSVKLRDSRIKVKTIKNEPIKDFSGNRKEPEKDLLTGLDLDIMDIYYSMKNKK